jgi:iron complex transport system permease protein
MTVIDIAARPAPRWRAGRNATAIAVAAAALVAVAAIVSLAVGPVGIAPSRVVAILLSAANVGEAEIARDTVIVLDVRLPRTVLALLVGAATAVAGAVMQGLFRNPLADPGIVGVSSGAALAAALWIVLGASAVGAALGPLAGLGLPIAAFAGGLIATVILQAIATREGRTSVTIVLLAGIALTGFTSAMTGFLIFVSSDQELRDFTFWMLGSIGGATWVKVALALPFALGLALLSMRLARGLDALSLGEADAHYSGVAVERVKRAAMVGVAAGVGAAVAVSGVIAFFGLTVPHLVRLTLGPGHRLLLPVSALIGAALLTLADVFARTVAAPAELPLGVVTAAVGAPLMLWLLMRRMRDFAV